MLSWLPILRCIITQIAHQSERKAAPDQIFGTNILTDTEECEIITKTSQWLMSLFLPPSLQSLLIFFANEQGNEPFLRHAPYFSKYYGGIVCASAGVQRLRMYNVLVCHEFSIKKEKVFMNPRATNSMAQDTTCVLPKTYWKMKDSLFACQLSYERE